MAKLRPSRRTPLEDAGFAVLRTPLLPVSEVFEWSSGLAAPAALAAGDEAKIEHCILADRQALTGRLRQILARDLVQQAISVASPGMAALLHSWLENPRGKRGQRAVPALVSYLLRMAYRPTPFGLFAGCSTIETGLRTCLELQGADQYRSHSRLDVVYLAALCQQLPRVDSLRHALLFRINPGLYQVAGQWRLAESHVSAAGNAGREFHLVSIEPSDSLAATLSRAVGGATIDSLVQGLLEDHSDISRAEARNYLEQLIESQVLLSALEPRVTSDDALGDILACLASAGTEARITGPLEVAAELLAQIDAAGPAASVGRYQGVSQALMQLPVNPSVLPKMHVDLYKPAPGARVGPRVIAAIREGIQLLHSLFPPAPREDLDTFTSEFQARYQGREVPLMQALDEESGIGFGNSAPEQVEDSPLIKGLDLARPGEPAISWSSRNAILLRMLGAALRSGSRVIDLGQSDFEGLEVSDPRPLPDALSASVTIVAPSAEAVDEGNFKLLWHGAFGPSGAMYLGRFCQGDSELKFRVQQHLRAEERHRPDTLFAEIVHLPQDRIGNVICRPCLRAYEIPFHGASGVEQEYQIPVSDLMVRVEDGRVVLRSARLDREVIPRLTTAHNAPQAELGAYRFLCALQTQGVCHWLAWDWGILESANYLPRVQAAKLVLSRARWRLGAADLKPIVSACGAELMLAVQDLRRRFELPRWIQLVQIDRLLPLDLENIICVELLSTLARDKPALDLTELYPMPEDACVSGPEGDFNHELIVPLQQPVTRQVNAAPGAAVIRDDACLYTPGSEWLYVKIYAGSTQAERILIEELTTFISQERSAGSFDRWFFLRYADPDTHLRLRFHGLSNQLAPFLQRLNEALAPYVDNGVVWRVQLDSYDPETARYGGIRGIGHSEAIFNADSDACIELLPLVAKGAERWHLVLLSAHRLFEDLSIDQNARLRQLSAMRDALISEFEFEESANRVLGRKHRELRKQVEQVLDGCDAAYAGTDPAREILDRRSDRIAPIAAELRKAQAAGSLDRSLDELALNYVHMTANRLLRAAARAQELVLYELLIRHYRSWLAQQK